MSLFLLGSCSKITAAIVKRLAAENLYRKIVIGDLLPSYSLFNRFYNLKAELETVDTQTNVEILKVSTLQSINDNLNQSNDILLITHDYSKNVISKTALIKEVAEDLKNQEGKMVLYVAPSQYDSYYYKDPYREYLTGQTVLRRKIPTANIIRTDVVEGAEFHQYYLEHGKKASFPFQKVHPLKNFRLLKQQTLLDEVVRILNNKPTGETVLLKGDASVDELHVSGKKANILGPVEKLLDTWGMSSNLGEMRKLDLEKLHTMLTSTQSK